MAESTPPTPPGAPADQPGAAPPPSPPRRRDPLRRLAIGATDEAAFRLYQDVVQVSFDPTEGIVRMEVIAADPDLKTCPLAKAPL